MTLPSDRHATTVDVRISGSHSASHTGAAVVHQEIAGRLRKHLGGLRTANDFRGPESLARRFLRSTGPPARVGIFTSTPLVLRPRADRVVPFIYDVRWQWTRKRLTRWYRRADLVRTARRADLILTISHTVADHLRLLGIEDHCAIHVVELGPGQVQHVPPPPVASRPPAVVLMGRAPHKRNELAASLLCHIPEVVASWRVIGISLSADTEATLRSVFSPAQLALHDDVGRDQLVQLISGARSYVALGVSEGFGFPYMEAAYLGCDVIAVRQALTIEVLGDDAVLLNDREPTTDQLAGALTAWDGERVRRLQARAVGRDWEHAASKVAQIIRPLLDS